jgi:hypothetical protein
MKLRPAVLAFALFVCLGVPSCGSMIYRHGFRGSIAECFREAGLMGLLDFKTADEIAAKIRGERRLTIP